MEKLLNIKFIILSSKNYYNVVLAWQSKYPNLNYKNLTSEFISDQLNYLSKLQSQSSFQINIFSQKIKIAQAQMQQSNSATVALWKTIFSNYNNALSLQSQTQDVLNKHINNLKSATAVSGDLSLLLQRELEGAKSAASSAASNYNNVAKQSQNLLQEYKAKNISNSSQLDSAIMEFTAMANKMEITVQDNRSMVAKMQSMMNDSISLDQ